MQQAPSGGEALDAWIARDPHRPQYHFLPPSNWMNDPNGLIQWHGEYHLFYQHNPSAPIWGNMHWGHAASQDLVHWRHLPVALEPTPGGPDKDGCWSGCGVDHDGVPTILYTGVFPEVQCLATSHDDLMSWQKYPGNPVLATPPPGHDVAGFRDPYVWPADGGWRMIVGSGIRGAGGTAFLYRSTDLVHWEYLNLLCSGDRDATEPVWTGSIWECPQFFALDGGHALIVSVWDEGQLHYAAYLTGAFDGRRFTPQAGGQVDFGERYFYAPHTMLDKQGRRLMWGWILEGRSVTQQQRAGWAGLMSLPRELHLGSDGHLRSEPVPELAALRQGHQALPAGDIAPAASLRLDVEADCAEIMAELEPGDAQQCGLQVRCSPHDEEVTSIYLDREAGRLVVNGLRSSLDPEALGTSRSGGFSLGENEALCLHVFLDRSVIEVFANGRLALTSRVYPSRPDSLGVRVFAHAGTAHLRSFDLWQLRSIWTHE